LVHLNNDGWPVGSWPVRSRCWAVRSRGRHNNWSWGIGSWGWGISWGWGVDGLSGVLDISNVSSVGIRGVGNSLETTIGKGNVVFSLGGISVAVLRSTEVSTAVSVIDSIGVVVCWGNIGVNWGRSVSGGRCVSRGRGIDGCWGILGSSTGNSHKGKQSNKALKVK
jgi:hypothetical protein